MAVTVTATRATSVSATRARMPGTSAGRPGGLVARPPHGHDQGRVRGVRLDLRPQPPDRDVHQPRIAEVVVAPDPVEERLPGEDLAGMLRELGEQVELRAREADLDAVARHGPSRRVDP